MSVVSGGALGIDAACHRGALAGGGSTIAILAGGVDVPYPRSNDGLFERIKKKGLLVSESPPGTPALRHRFLVRNRLIAAWGWGTVVLEAQIRSGAIATASHAAGLNRDVMAVPGPITSTSSEGCHQLIRDGAVLVTSASDILELVRGDLPRHAPHSAPVSSTLGTLDL
jgi:DNA processing protein